MSDKKTKGKGGRPRKGPPDTRHRSWRVTDEERAVITDMIALMRATSPEAVRAAIRRGFSPEEDRS